MWRRIPRYKPASVDWSEMHLLKFLLGCAIVVDEEHLVESGVVGLSFLCVLGSVGRVGNASESLV